MADESLERVDAYPYSLDDFAAAYDAMGWRPIAHAVLFEDDDGCPCGCPQGVLAAHKCGTCGWPLDRHHEADCFRHASLQREFEADESGRIVLGIDGRAVRRQEPLQ